MTSEIKNLQILDGNVFVDGNMVQDYDRDLELRYILRFGVQPNKRIVSAIIDGEFPTIAGTIIAKENSKLLMFTIRGKEVFSSDRELLSSLVKFHRRNTGVLTASAMRQGFSYEFVNHDTLQTIYNYFICKQNDASTRLIYRRDMLARYNAVKSYNSGTYRFVPSTKSEYAAKLIEFHDRSLPFIFHGRYSKEIYADQWSEFFDFKKPNVLWLPYMRGEVNRGIYFPPCPLSRRDVVASSIFASLFPPFSKDYVPMSNTGYVFDEILWNEGKRLASLYLRGKFAELKLSPHAKIAILAENRFNYKTGVKEWTCGTVTCDGVTYKGRYEIERMLNGDSPLLNVETLEKENVVDFILPLPEIPEVKSYLSPIEGTENHLLTLVGGEILPLEEEDLLLSLPNASGLKFQRLSDQKVILNGRFAFDWVQRRYKLDLRP